MKNLLQKAEGQTDIWFLLLKHGTSLYEMWNFSSWLYFLCFVITSQSQVSSWKAEPSLPCKHSGSLQVHPVLCSRQTCVSCEANLIQHNWLKFGNSKRQSVAKYLQSGLNFFLGFYLMNLLVSDDFWSSSLTRVSTSASMALPKLNSTSAQAWQPARHTFHQVLNAFSFYTNWPQKRESEYEFV